MVSQVSSRDFASWIAVRTFRETCEAASMQCSLSLDTSEPRNPEPGVSMPGRGPVTSRMAKDVGNGARSLKNF